MGKGLLIPMRKLIVLAAALVVLVATYAAVGFFVVPRLVRSQAQDFVSEKYGRTAEIGEVRFNPFTFTLEVDRFVFPDSDGKPLASFETLLVNFELSSLWRRGASFKEIAIGQPNVRAILRENGSLNLADFAKPFEDEPEVAEEDTGPTRLFIDLFRLDAGQTSFEDRTLAPPYTAVLVPITFELRDFSTTGDTDNAYDLHAQFGEGQTLDWSGDVTLTPLASKGQFKFANFTVNRQWAYVREATGLEVTTASFGFDGHYDFLAGETATKLNVTLREFSGTELGIRPPGQAEDTLRFTRFAVGNATLDLGKRAVNVEKIAFEGGKVHAWRDEGGLINLLELGSTSAPPAAGDSAAAPPAAAPAPPAEAESPWIITAPDIRLQGLQVRVEDRQITPVVELLLDPFNLHVAGFSTAPATSITITTDMGVNESGRLEAQAKYAMDPGDLEGEAGLTAFDLTVAQPYLDQFTQMDLQSGRLYERSSTSCAPETASWSRTATCRWTS